MSFIFFKGTLKHLQNRFKGEEGCFSKLLFSLLCGWKRTLFTDLSSPYSSLFTPFFWSMWSFLKGQCCGQGSRGKPRISIEGKHVKATLFLTEILTLVLTPLTWISVYNVEIQFYILDIYAIYNVDWATTTQTHRQITHRYTYIYACVHAKSP